MNKKVLFNKPYISKIDKKYINKVFNNGKFTDGLFQKKCENLIKKKIKSKFVALTQNCSSALEIAILLLNLKKSDEVIMPSYTFTSTANAVLLSGAKPVFADINLGDANLDPNSVEKKINKNTKAIILVHYGGNSCDMDEFIKIKKKYNLVIVEDAAHGFLGKFKNKYLGTIGDFGAFSFHETKNFVGGQCGALSVNNTSFLNKVNIDCDESNISTCIPVEDFYKFLTSKYDEKFDYNIKVEEIVGKTFDNLNRNIYQELRDVIKKSKNIGDNFHNFYYFISKIFDGYEIYKTLYQTTNLIKVRDSKIQDSVRKNKSLYYLSLQPEQLLDEVILYLYLEPSQFPFINFRFDPPSSYKYYMTRSYKQSDHNPKMNKLGLLNRGNERKKLDYIIQNKLDNYFYLFNPTNSFYKYKITSVERYYLVMFPDKNKKDIVKNYNIGFSWVLNYYFNNKTDILWFYPYSRTPLLTDIVEMYDKNAGKLNFDEKRIFNPLESIIFITPIDESMNLDFLPKFVSNEIKEKIKLFISKNKHFFLPLTEINRILITDYKNLTDLLDCSVSIFLNKCHYKLLEKNIDPELFIKKFREIIPTKDQPFKNNYSFKCIDLKL